MPLPNLRRSFEKPEVASLVILVCAVVFFALANGKFLSPLNMNNFLAFLPELGLIALGMTLLLTAGEFDLSVGAVFAFCPVTTLLISQHTALPFAVALGIALCATALIGLVNGLFVTRLGISSFLVTLSTLLIVRGSTVFATQGFPLESLKSDSLLVPLLVGSFAVGGLKIYASLLWFAGLALLFHYILNRAKVGNWISAIGSNRNAALARGVPVARVKTGLFVLVSLMAGLAGGISALRISAASPVAGEQYELEAIAMVVVGGTALTGGRGTIWGTVIGIVLIRIIRNGIVLLGVPGLAFNIFVGAIILTMLIVHGAISGNTSRG